MKLAELQRAVLDALYAERLPDDATANVGMTEGSRLDIYRGNLVMGLVSALRETFGFCEHLLGERNFEFLCRAHLLAHPMSGRLDDHGATLPAFLRTRAEVADLPFIGDVAQLEWNLDRSFRTAPVAPMPVDAVQRILASEPEDVWFELQPSLRCFPARHAIFDAWSVFRDGQADQVDQWRFEPHPEAIATWNRDGEAMAMRAPPQVGALLSALHDGASLVEATEAGTPDAVGHALQLAFSRGWLVGARVEPPPG